MSENKLTKIWVTRWALTKGVFQVEAQVHTGANMASYTSPGSYIATYVHRDDFHLTERAALAHAYIMRAKKIQSLHKQLEKLQKLSFPQTE